jgi:hypothetical protein
MRRDDEGVVLARKRVDAIDSEGGRNGGLEELI